MSGRKDEIRMQSQDLEKQVEITNHLHVLLALLLHSFLDAK